MDSPHLVVITLDIGDMYSGYAYTYHDDFQKDGWTIHMNEPWYREKHSTNKTCTTILMTPDANKTATKYGYEAETDFAEKFLDGVHTDYILFQHIKAEFYKDHVSLTSEITDVNSGKKKPLGDVFLMFLNFLKEKAIERVKKKVSDICMDNIYWVLTVPAAWKQETTLLYRDLAMESGISHRNLRVVTEPEACLAYGMQYLRKRVEVLERKEISEVISLFDARVLVLDLSGDATTISVHRVSGDKTFNMVFQSRSHRKGSNQVNEQFLLFLSNILGEDIIRTLRTDYKDDYQALCIEFEMRKRKIKSTTPLEDFFTFRFPYQLEETFKEKYGDEYKTIHQRLVQSDYKDRVRYEGSKLSVQNGVLWELFRAVIDKIAVYINNVLAMSKCARVESFLLVGGFSHSTIVQDMIREHFPNITVIVPEEPELAIMKGAIIMGMTSDTRPPTPPDGSYRRKVKQTSVSNAVSQVCEIL